MKREIFLFDFKEVSKIKAVILLNEEDSTYEVMLKLDPNLLMPLNDEGYKNKLLKFVLIDSGEYSTILKCWKKFITHVKKEWKEIQFKKILDKKVKEILKMEKETENNVPIDAIFLEKFNLEKGFECLTFIKVLKSYKIKYFLKKDIKFNKYILYIESKWKKKMHKLPLELRVEIGKI